MSDTWNPAATALLKTVGGGGAAFGLHPRLWVQPDGVPFIEYGSTRKWKLSKRQAKRARKRETARRHKQRKAEKAEKAHGRARA